MKIVVDIVDKEEMTKMANNPMVRAGLIHAGLAAFAGLALCAVSAQVQSEARRHGVLDQIGPLIGRRAFP